MAGKRPYDIHLFNCLSESACLSDGPAKAIHARLKTLVKDEGVADRVRINKAGCLNQCGHGPMLVVYPEGVWYCHLRLEDADRVFYDHLLTGRPVEELRYDPPGPGANKLPRRPLEGDVVGPVDTQSPEWAPCRRCP